MKTLRIIPDDWLNPLDLEKYFSVDKPLEVDVGSGKGRFLLARAAANPEVNYLGIDRMLRRIKKVDKKAIRNNLLNIRLLRLDAYYTVTYLIPAESVSNYYIFFPDPWPKARHHMHRFFNNDFLGALYRTMLPNGQFHFATDHLPYFEEVVELMSKDERFKKISDFKPTEAERTDFELLFYQTKPIGRCSFCKIV